MNQGASEDGSHFECILNKLGNGVFESICILIFFLIKVISGVEVQLFSVACLYVVAFSTLVANHEWIFKRKH